MNHLPVASVRLDTRACILHANAMAEDLLATSARRMRGAAITRFLPDGAKLLEQTKEQMGGQMGTVSARKATLINAQGGKISVSVHAAWGREDEWEGRQEGWTLVLIPIVLKDMTARANALKHQAGTISTMNAMLAHEIKNPLAAIRGAAQLMRGGQGDLARLIIAESDRISDLIDTMQLFTSLDEVGDRACNVHTVLSAVLEGISASVGRNHCLVPDYDPSLPQVQGNAAVLHRVLTNLIKNACEACGPAGGYIQLRTRYVLSDKRPVAGGKPKAHLPICVSIIDNGHGVSEDMVDRIFNAFISTKDQGRGLGLAYVAQAVADMGGVIELITETGRTEFQLRLPAVLGRSHSL